MSKVTATVCEFILQPPAARCALRVEVRRRPSAQWELQSQRDRCGVAAEPLRGIGNEAFYCPKDREVVGRVRDALFTVRIVGRKAPSLDSPKEKTTRVAEQVAGALF